jgi:hypothetical protein
MRQKLFSWLIEQMGGNNGSGDTIPRARAHGEVFPLVAVANIDNAVFFISLFCWFFCSHSTPVTLLNFSSWRRCQLGRFPLRAILDL